MGCYQLLLAREFPDRNITATIYALRSGASATTAMSPLELDQFEKDVKLLGDEILTQEYYDLTPRLKRLCHDCDFLALCKRQEDFAEEWSGMMADD